MTYHYEPGFLGDHGIVDRAIAEGMQLSRIESKWHNWSTDDGDSNDPDYDEGIYELAQCAKAFLEKKGYTVINTEE
jgi:hypothetical protein